MWGMLPVKTNRFDERRKDITGIEEAVFCESKTPEQIDEIALGLLSNEASALFTRLTKDKFSLLSDNVKSVMNFDEDSLTGFLNRPHQPLSQTQSEVGIVTAGTSDFFLAKEAHRTLEYYNIHSDIVVDVGVAGLWRILDVLDQLKTYKVLIAIAGMEGALFSVLAGLVKAPVIAVPSSVGYGVTAGGEAALNSALGSCSPGILTVNIDNAFGAACAAIKMLNTCGSANY